MPTLKQKRVAKKILENPRISLYKAMREAGYSRNTAIHPKDLINSKGWGELIDDVFPDELLVTTHRELFDAKKIILSRTEGKTEVIAEIPDWKTRLKAVVMAYKLKGLYPDRRSKKLKFPQVC